MNIVHGDSAAGAFKAALLIHDNDLLVFRDVLSCGPSEEFSDIKKWRYLRLSFWNDVCSHICEAMPPTEKMQRDFYNNFSTCISATECKLWIGTGLSDQLLLAFIVHLFQALHLDFNKFSVVQFEKMRTNTSGDQPVQGLGLLKPGQIRKHPAPHTLNKEQVRYANSAWEAFVGTYPEQYIQFMAAKNGVMPLLHHAMSSIFYRYPHATNGLSRFDENLLKNTSLHGPKATKVIGYTLGDDLRELDLVGDWYLFSRLKNLASPQIKYPLVTMNSHNRPMRETEVQITEFGKLALNRKVIVFNENGLNDWVGGVHLDSKNIWVRKEKRLIQMKQSQP